MIVNSKGNLTSKCPSGSGRGEKSEGGEKKSARARKFTNVRIRTSQILTSQLPLFANS